MTDILVQHAKVRVKLMTGDEAFEVAKACLGKLSKGQKESLKKMLG